MGEAKVSEIHNKLLISDIKQWLGGHVVYLSMFAFERTHSLQHVAAPSAFFKQWDFPKQEVIRLHTSQWSSNIKLSSP